MKAPEGVPVRAGAGYGRLRLRRGRVMDDGKNRDFLQRFRSGIWLVVGVIVFVLIAVMIS